MNKNLSSLELAVLVGKSSFTLQSPRQEVMTDPRATWSPAIPRFVPNSTDSPARSKAARSKGARMGRTARSKHEEQFALLLRHFKFPPPKREHQFDTSGRKWRFDFAWPDQMVAVEIEGGIWSPRKSGHTTGAGITRDAEKSNAAQLQGWLVLRFVESHIEDGTAIELTRRAIGLSANE